MRWSRIGVSVAASALAAILGLQRSTQAAPGGYEFIKLVDHIEDNYSPRSFTCASINEAGDIAFKASRSAEDGLSFWDVIARVSRTGEITTIVEDPARTQFQFFGNTVSINDFGQTSFGAFRSNDNLEIIRADPGSLVTIASTAGAFDAFGFDTQLNNDGEVAFTGRLDDGNRGLFSGAGGSATTHYLDSTPVLVDGVTTDLFGGNFSRPAINNAGELAFWDLVEPSSSEGVFAGRSGVFRTLGRPDGNRRYRDPNLNDLGIGAFETSFVNAAGQSVTAIVRSSNGVLSTVADTLSGFGAFGFYAPAINRHGQVAFEGLLTDFTTNGVFAGPNPRKDAIITSADKLDGARIVSTSIALCAEGLNDSGEVAFIVDVEDNRLLEGFRSAIYLATPKKR
jgi:hypothetical protein